MSPNKTAGKGQGGGLNTHTHTHTWLGAGGQREKGKDGKRARGRCGGSRKKQRGSKLELSKHSMVTYIEKAALSFVSRGWPFAMTVLNGSIEMFHLLDLLPRTRQAQREGTHLVSRFSSGPTLLSCHGSRCDILSGDMISVYLPLSLHPHLFLGFP